jgi:hypothetical protein
MFCQIVLLHLVDTVTVIVTFTDSSTVERRMEIIATYSLSFDNDLQINKFGYMGPRPVEKDGLWRKQPCTSFL